MITNEPKRFHLEPFLVTNNPNIKLILLFVKGKERLKFLFTNVLTHGNSTRQLFQQS